MKSYQPRMKWMGECRTLPVRRAPANVAVLLLALLTSFVIARSNSQGNRDEEITRQGEADLDQRRDKQTAARLLQEGFTLALKDENLTLVSHSASELANAYIDLGEFGKVQKVAENFLSLARLKGDRRQEAWALDLMGNALFARDDYPQALKIFGEAVALMRETGDRQGEAVALKDLGIAHKYLYNLDEGIATLYAALDIFREHDNQLGVMSTLQNIGMGYLTLGYKQQALEMYAQALALAQAAQDDHEVHHALLRIGMLRLSQGQPDLALRELQQALAIAENLNLCRSQAYILSGLSAAFLELGRVDEAIAAQRRSCSLCNQSSSWLSVANCHRDLGYLYLERDPKLAANYFQRSLAITTQQGFPSHWSSHHGLARAQMKLGELDQGIESYLQAVTAVESVRASIATEQRRAYFIENHQQIYLGLIETLLKRNKRSSAGRDDIRAFSFYERAKARALLEAFTAARSNAEQELSPELRVRREVLTARIGDSNKRLLTTDLSNAERQRTLKQLEQAEREFELLITEIKRHHPRYAAMNYPQPASLEQVQAALDGSTALVAYLMTPDQLLAFVVTAGDFHLAQLPAAPQTVAMRVQNYVDLLATSDDNGWQSISRRLYVELVAPLRQFLPATIKHLIVIPDGALHNLPFETLIVNGAQMLDQHGPTALPARPNEGTATPAPGFLFEDFALSYAPSASMLVELDASRNKTGADNRADLLMFAAPAIPPDQLGASVPHSAGSLVRTLYEREGLKITPIPSSAAEANTVARFAGSGSQVLTGLEASERRIKTEPLARYRILHFATHGFISQEVPARSALVMSATGKTDTEDGFLQVREIYQLSLQCDLVVLSSCQTARGRILAGEGIEGMAQAFFYAGARSVVASLWNVSDEQTTALIKFFYRHLANGESKAGALRAAKLDMLSHNKNLPPRYWAAFILIGDADEPVQMDGVSNGSLWWGLAGASLLIVITVMILYRHRIRRGENANSINKDANENLTTQLD